jgi:hypothetical protein
VAWQFVSTAALSTVWSCDKNVIVGWLLFIVRSQVWIKVESNVYRRDSMVLPVIEIYNGGIRILASFPPFVFFVIFFCCNLCKVLDLFTKFKQVLALLSLGC